MAKQLQAKSLRPDLLKEEELREQSQRFLEAFLQGLKEGNLEDLKDPAWAPALAVLTEVSQSRGQQGFTPVETATFVFSLKSPLFFILREMRDGSTEAWGKDTLAVNDLIDQLGLFTTEIHQRAREGVIRRQQEEMLELSTPVVKLFEGIVALPLIGTLDSARTNVVMESLLQTIVETGSEIAILDITGVPTVDTLVAQHLLKTVAAARLMGADCIISGIRPQIAQTMVHLAIDLSAVTTKATMAEALQTALRRRGYAIARPVESRAHPGT